MVRSTTRSTSGARSCRARCTRRRDVQRLSRPARASRARRATRSARAATTWRLRPDRASPAPPARALRRLPHAEEDLHAGARAARPRPARPAPDLSDRLGTPNACQQCHADRPSSWAAAALEKAHGQRDRPRHWGEVLHAGG
jgi:hypothetical protein